MIARSGQRRARRLVGVTTVVGMLVSVGLLVLGIGPASAAPTASLSPSSGITDGQVIQVSITLDAPTPAGVFLAVTQCGNATTAGTPLTAAGANDCVGQEALGSSLQLLGSGGVGDITGSIPAGTYVVPLTMKKSGMGVNKTQCIALPPATLPCSVQIATAKITGQYTGAGAFTISAPFTYVGQVATTTTTKASTTTTSTQASTTTTNPGSTTTTQASTTTTTPGGGGPSAVVTPNTELSDGQVVNVRVTLGSPTPAGVFVAITQCGNATSGGSPLGTVATDDCEGAAGLGTSLQLLGKNGVGDLTGGVPAGTYDVPLTMKKAGIGVNGTQCMPVATGVLPCNVQVASATLTGAYTGNGSFAVKAPISYSVTSVTTVPRSTTTTVPRSIIITLPGGGTTMVEVLGTQQTATTVTAVSTSGTLPYTGVNSSLWWQVALGVIFLDLGYLASTVARKQRPSR